MSVVFDYFISFLTLHLSSIYKPGETVSVHGYMRMLDEHGQLVFPRPDVFGARNKSCTECMHSLVFVVLYLTLYM